MKIPTYILIVCTSFIFVFLSACRQANDEQPYMVKGQSNNADDLLIVDCLLPGKIKKLGKMTYQSRRQAVKTTAALCEIRGGEYTAYNRSDFSTALSVWLPQAKAGDLQAQTYVGEIYQKGLGIEPQYEIAAEWYKKAAAKGNSRAQMNLGFLYEKGLGVGKDPERALSWYRKASGLGDLLELESNSLSIEERLELESLRKEIEKSKAEEEKLRKQLDNAKRDLESSRRQLRIQQSNLKKQLNVLEKERSELKRKKAETGGVTVDTVALQNAERELAERERKLRKQEEKIASLQKKVQSSAAEMSEYQNQLSNYKEQFDKLPDPIIEIHDPRIVATRGVKVAPVSSDSSQHEIAGKVWAPAGLNKFVVNGTTRQVKPDGVFRFTLPADKKEQKIKVSMLAVDSRGKKATTSFELLPEDSVPDTVAKKDASTIDFSTITFGKYYALVIGNNLYRQLPKLESAIHDAEAVSDILQKKYGFEAEVLVNATRYDILAALNKYLRILTEKDNFLLYYAGHGELDTKNSRGYWLPVDADQDSNVNWIPSFAITDILNNMTAKQIIVVADTCYSGILTRSAIARLQPGMSDEVRYNYLKSMSQKRSRMVLSSGELKPVLDAGGGKHSIFARAFLDVLQSNDGILEGWTLYNRVTKIVTYNSEKFGYQQVPQYSALIRGGHESGGFFFVPASFSR